jgi:hypothetical protein
VSISSLAGRPSQGWLASRELVKALKFHPSLVPFVTHFGPLCLGILQVALQVAEVFLAALQTLLQVGDAVLSVLRALLRVHELLFEDSHGSWGGFHDQADAL